VLLHQGAEGGGLHGGEAKPGRARTPHGQAIRGCEGPPGAAGAGHRES
jgi:hypothetical protein